MNLREEGKKLDENYIRDNEEKVLQHIKKCLIGERIEAVEKELEKKGWTYRVVKKNGVNGIITRDIIAIRINLIVKNDKVSDLYFG